MTGVTWQEIEGDLRLPLRRLPSPSIWPIVAASLLLHAFALFWLYPGGGSTPLAPDNALDIRVAFVMPGDVAGPATVSAAFSEQPTTVTATDAAEALPAQVQERVAAAIDSAEPAPPTSVEAREASTAPPTPAQSLDVLDVAVALPREGAPALSSPPNAAHRRAPDLAERPRATAATPPLAQAARRPPTPDAARSGAAPATPPRVVQVASPAATEAPPAPVPTAAPPAVTQPRRLLAAPTVRAGSTTSPTASAASPKSARPAAIAVLPPSRVAGVADVAEAKPIRAYQAPEILNVPPPPLPPRRPPSMLAREANPRILRPNARIENAPPPQTTNSGSVAGGAPPQTAAPTDPAGRPRSTTSPSANRVARTDPAEPPPEGVSRPAAFRGPGFWNPPPAYPPEARRRRLGGRVLINVEVTARGRARGARIARSSGHRVLDQAALRAVRGWRFLPALKDGVPTSDRIDVPIAFRPP